MAGQYDWRDQVLELPTDRPRPAVASEKILEIILIGVRDNFFDLGGQSLLAVRLRFQIHKMSGRELPLALLFERPTIEELAQVLRQQIPVSGSSLLPIKPSGSKPPLFFVQLAILDTAAPAISAALTGSFAMTRPWAGVNWCPEG